MCHAWDYPILSCLLQLLCVKHPTDGCRAPVPGEISFSLDPVTSKLTWGLECSPVEEYLPSMGKVLGSTPISAKEQKSNLKYALFDYPWMIKLKAKEFKMAPPGGGSHAHSLALPYCLRAALAVGPPSCGLSCPCVWKFPLEPFTSSTA